MKTGIELISEERLRQVSTEGWSSDHDDQHDLGELARAAIAYARYYTPMDGISDSEDLWPWDRHWWKPRDPVQCLVKAGALIAAEIDRLHRLSGECKNCSDREHCGSEFCRDPRGPEILGHTIRSYRSATP